MCFCHVGAVFFRACHGSFLVDNCYPEHTVQTLAAKGIPCRCASKDRAYVKQYLLLCIPIESIKEPLMQAPQSGLNRVSDVVCSGLLNFQSSLFAGLL